MPRILVYRAQTDLGLLQLQDGALCDNSYRLKVINYYHKALHLRCCSSPRSTSAEQNGSTWSIVFLSEVNYFQGITRCIFERNLTFYSLFQKIKQECQNVIMLLLFCYCCIVTMLLLVRNNFLITSTSLHCII